jgi:hypothetical protein
MLAPLPMTPRSFVGDRRRATPCTSTALEAFRSRGPGHTRAASNGLRTPDILRAPTKHRRHYSMPQLRRRRHGPQPNRRRALKLFASYRDGCTEALMIARGFTVRRWSTLYAPDIRGSTNQTDVRCDHSNQ